MCTKDAASDKIYGRKNFEALVVAFLPPKGSDANPFAVEPGAAAAAATATADAECDATCVLKYVAEKFVSTEVLVPCVIIGIILIVFSQAVWGRSASELREARAANEFREKKKIRHVASA